MDEKARIRGSVSAGNSLDTDHDKYRSARGFNRWELTLKIGPDFAAGQQRLTLIAYVNDKGELVARVSKYRNNEIEHGGLSEELIDAKDVGQQVEW